MYGDCNLYNQNVIHTDLKRKLQNNVGMLYLYHKYRKGLTLRSLKLRRIICFLFGVLACPTKIEHKIQEEFKLRNTTLGFYCVCVCGLFYST